MLITVFTSVLAAAAVAAGTCPVDLNAALKLTPRQFDQDVQVGWRPLGNQAECAVTAAGLIADYRRAHWGELNPTQLHASYWHEAQMLAAGGETRKAVPLFLAGVDPEAFGSADYALATVAFLQHDRIGLQAARARLARLPKPADFDAEARRIKSTQGIEMSWPPNLDVVDGLIACFGKTYRAAYGDSC